MTGEILRALLGVGIAWGGGIWALYVALGGWERWTARRASRAASASTRGYSQGKR